MTYSTYQLILYIWIAIGVLTFLLLLKVTAPYGRHTKSNWGLMIDNRLGWIIMELPALVVTAAFFFTGPGMKSVAVWVFYSIFTIHYLNRVFIFPFRLHTRGKKMPVVIMLSAVFFNLVNGFAIGYYLGNFAGNYTNAWLLDHRFISGILIFITGMYINMHADNRLISLRRDNPGRYVIPRGTMFNYISCPNHFGEIVEWTGYAILTWSLPGFAFMVWTMANLIPRALDHHKWYKEKFGDYPEERKAVLPFIL